jgi:phage terminase large subunit-like protein
LNTEGLPVELFGQGMASMSGPSKEFERLVMGLDVEHGNHPVARWMAKNVAIHEDAAGNIKPVKDKSAGKIDGVTAAIMAKGMLMAKPLEMSPYDVEAAALKRAAGEQPAPVLISSVRSPYDEEAARLKAKREQQKVKAA